MVHHTHINTQCNHHAAPTYLHVPSQSTPGLPEEVAREARSEAQTDKTVVRPTHLLMMCVEVCCCVFGGVLGSGAKDHGLGRWGLIVAEDLG